MLLYLFVSFPKSCIFEYKSHLICNATEFLIFLGKDNINMADNISNYFLRKKNRNRG